MEFEIFGWYNSFQYYLILREKNKKNPTALHFGGFAASGGSALRDLFYEYTELFVFPAEFRLLKEKNGLLDLEKALFISKSPDNIDLAIRDFKKLAYDLARITTKFTRFGFSYDKFTDKNFTKFANNFIDEITDYKYPLNTHNYDFRKSTFKSQLDRYASRLLPYSFFEKDAYMAYPKYESFMRSAKKLLNLTFQAAFMKEGFNPKYIGLHNIVNPFTLEGIYNSYKYFDDFKMIIIDRDPRDIFIDFPHHRYLPRNVDNVAKAKCFIHFFKSLRKKIKEVAQLEFCLILSFEELVINYDETLKKIEAFLGISDKNASLKKKLFSPEDSIKNIKKYKKLDCIYDSSIKLIEDELTDFLYP